MTISSSKRASISKKLKEKRPVYKRAHVIPQKGRWSIKIEGSEKATKILTSQKKAITYAKSAVVGKFTRDIVVHKRDGTITSMGTHTDRKKPTASVRKTGRPKK
jgi:hypothetical protein